MLKPSSLPKSDDGSIKPMYLNRPQMLVWLVNARITVLRWARGTGKTSRALAMKVLRNAIAMPRSSGAFAGESYIKILSSYVQEMVGAWEEFGLVEGKDFVVCKTPPKNFKRGLLSPQKFDHYVSFKWGSGFHLIGFDYRSSSNGLSVQWLTITEAKKQPFDRIQKELMPTLRGNGHLFGHLPEHMSILIESDGNIGPKDHNWIERYKNQSSSDSDIALILALQEEIDGCTDEAMKALLREELHKLQKTTTYFLEASSVENIAILTIDYFETQAQSLDPEDFLESLGNIPQKRAKGTFYALLDEDIHMYEPIADYSYIDRHGSAEYLSNRDCESDTDWRKNIALKLSIDLGAHYSWFVVNQKYNNTYYSLKGFWVKSPLKFQDGVHLFCKYYAKQAKKVVELYYDIQANKENTRSTQTDATVIIQILRSYGWTVVDKCEHKQYIPHYIKHRIWMNVLYEPQSPASKPRDSRYSMFRCNAFNAKFVFISMGRALVKRTGSKEIQKDKSSEKDPLIPQETATHFSDAQDNIICYDHYELIVPSLSLD